MIILLVLLAAFASLVYAQTYSYKYIIGTVTVKEKDYYYVSQLSNVDSSVDKGTHSNFTAQQYGPDLITDVLIEENTSSGSDTLWLYVNTTDLSKTDWTRIGYPENDSLNAIDYPNYYIQTGKKGLEGDFHFTDSGKSTETMTSVTVQIYGMHNLTNKQLEVFVWNGSSWISLEFQTLPTSWTWVNYTATTVLNTWAKIDGAKIYLESSDNGVDYYVDCARLQVEYDSTNYEADLEVQWTNVDYNGANEELCIYGGAMGSESLRVDVWNGSLWQNLIASLNSGWNNVSVSAYLALSTFTIRFKGSAETADATQDSWAIDATLLHVWT